METTGVTAPRAPAGIVFTDAAARKVGELIREEDNPNLKLRVFISGGGCSGFQYGFTFDEDVEDGDSQVENQGVMLLIIIQVIYATLISLVIDFDQDLDPVFSLHFRKLHLDRSWIEICRIQLPLLSYRPDLKHIVPVRSQPFPKYHVGREIRHF